MSLLKSYTNTLRKRYATFSGRANRREYCALLIVHYTCHLIGQAFLGCSMATFIAEHGLIADIAALSDGVAFGYLFLWFITLIHFIPFLALRVRRLHDLDTSGWWLLLVLLLANALASIGINNLMINIFLGFLGFMEGSPKQNDFGNLPAKKDNVTHANWFLGVVLLIDTMVFFLY